jgi:hypothetical protein
VPAPNLVDTDHKRSAIGGRKDVVGNRLRGAHSYTCSYCSP